jgi:DNA-binding CsgD family transcriptional regulator
VLVTSLHRERFVRLLHRSLDVHEFFAAADRALNDTVPFDKSCWLSFDPATLLPTGHFTRDAGVEDLMALAANEFLEDDVNRFADLARRRPPVATLQRVTGGLPSRSPRFVGILAPLGHEHGDELRATFVDGGAAWGGLAIHRTERHFDDRDVDFVADVSRLIAQGIRRAILVTALAVETGPEPPGLLILAADNSVESVNAGASHWLDELFDAAAGPRGVPLVLAALAGQARKSAAGRSDALAHARLPRRTGGWLLVDATSLDGAGDRIAIILHPAREPEVADLIVKAYGLSPRECEVTGLVLRGLSTQEIAESLHVTGNTVQDHLKAIFEKVGVRSRRELTAQLFQQQYAPRLAAGASVGSDGWFAEERRAESR